MQSLFRFYYFFLFLLFCTTNSSQQSVNVTEQEKKELGNQLLVAATQLRVDVVKQLVQKGAPVDFKSCYTHVTPLTLVSLYNDPKAIELADFFLTGGASVNQEGAKFKTPLHVACQTGSKELVELFIKKGAKIGSYDFEGYLPFHYACQKGNLSVVQILQKYGQNIHAKTLDKENGLHCVGTLAVARYLYNQGVNILERNKKERFPFDLAIEKDIKNFFLEKTKEHWIQKVQQDISMIDKPRCGVCLGTIASNQGYFTDCGHQFHQACFETPAYLHYDYPRPESCYICRKANPQPFLRTILVAYANRVKLEAQGLLATSKKRKATEDGREAIKK